MIPAGGVPLLTDQVYGEVPPVTVSVSVYAALTSPDGGAAKLSTGPPTTVIEVALVALWPLASVTLTVKLEVPSAVGVPASTPVDAFRVIPAGGVPLLTDQVYGAVPPVAVSVSL